MQQLDTANPSTPIQICPAPPLFRRIGLAIGYWEPMALTDVTRSPDAWLTPLQPAGFW
nr:IncF plasmid conjugative transfer pilus assembly protein TraU [Escherichia coli]